MKNPKLYRPGFVYLIRRQPDGACKIGASQNPIVRVSTLRCYRLQEKNQGVTGDVTLLGFGAVENMADAESALHEEYRDFNVGGEWFNLSQSQISTILARYSSRNRSQMRAVPVSMERAK